MRRAGRVRREKSLRGWERDMKRERGEKGETRDSMERDVRMKRED